MTLDGGETIDADVAVLALGAIRNIVAGRLGLAVSRLGVATDAPAGHGG